MIAVDTNILLYAHRRASPWHLQASQILKNLAEGAAPWAIPWPCLHEFIAVATHPKIFSPPSTLDQALRQVEAWVSSPTVKLLSEDEGFYSDWRTTLIKSKIAGPIAHDAKIVTLCKIYGVRPLYSADRDFSRFPDLNVKNPLIGD